MRLKNCVNIWSDAGFTLIELMISLVIIAVLTLLVYPSVQTSMRQQHSDDILLELTDTQIRLEQCYAQNTSYNAPCVGLPNFPHISSQGYYEVNLSELTSKTYILTATPLNKNDHTLTLNQASVPSTFHLRVSA